MTKLNEFCRDCFHPQHAGTCNHVCQCPDGSLTFPPKVVTLQELINVGFNGFGLQLFVESIVDRKADIKEFRPVTFSYKGVLVTLAPDPDHEIDGRHQ